MPMKGPVTFKVEYEGEDYEVTCSRIKVRHLKTLPDGELTGPAMVRFMDGLILAVVDASGDGVNTDDLDQDFIEGLVDAHPDFRDGK